MKIRKQFTIAGPVFFSDPFPANSMHPDDRIAFYEQGNFVSQPVSLTVSGINFRAVFLPSKKLIVEGDFPDDKVFIDYISDNAIPSNQAYEDLLANIEAAADKILEVIKYIFDFHRIKEYLKFSTSAEMEVGGVWQSCADRRNLIWVPDQVIFQMDRGTVEGIQEVLDAGIEPLHAMKFLSKAKGEENLRDKCLLLATAAEQAVKEFLVRRAHPFDRRRDNIETLYDTRLTELLGSPSPYLAEVLENARLRNQIVHVPAHDPAITAADSIRLTDAIEKAILHLMTELYPGNAMLANLLAKVDNSRPA